MSRLASRSPPIVPRPARDLFIPPWVEDRGVRAFVRDHARPECAFYGHGKSALRDGLDVLAAHEGSECTSVLLPAYVPSAIVEPIREAGYEPTFYRITPTLEPNLTDISRELDEQTLALLTVNYFGFPQPKQSELATLAAEKDVRLIEDNAHAALSRTADGQLLGTRGDIGFTSFKKTLPVPDGAVLYLSREELLGTPLSRSGVRSGLTSEDLRYLGGGLLGRLFQSARSTSHNGASPEEALEEGRDLWDRDPAAIYERSKGPMSKLSGLVLDRIRPEALVARKRRNFRAQLDAIQGIDHCTPVFDSMATGTCPQVCPVRVDEWQPLCEALGVERDELPRWPPLPAAVATNDRFHTSHTLARRLVPLPV